jgi:hypothetical protein
MTHADLLVRFRSVGRLVSSPLAMDQFARSLPRTVRSFKPDYVPTTLQLYTVVCHHRQEELLTHQYSSIRFVSLVEWL